jgi:hypothetical protein
LRNWFQAFAFKCNLYRYITWPGQYPGMWKGKILGSASGGSSAIGNDASPSNAVPEYNVVVQGGDVHVERS